MKKKRWRRIFLGIMVFSLILTAGFPRPVLAKKTNMNGEFQVVQQRIKPWNVRKRSYQLKNETGRKCPTCTVPKSLKDLDYHYGFYAAPKYTYDVSDYHTLENIVYCMEPHNGLTFKIDTVHDEFVYAENSEPVRKKLYKYYEARESDYDKAARVVNYALAQGEDEHFMLHYIYLLTKRYKESDDLVDPGKKNMAGKTLSECKSAIKGDVYKQYPAMRKDQEMATEALMMVKRMKAPEKRTFTVDKTGDLDIKIPDFAVTGTRISSADSNLLIPETEKKALGRDSSQVDSGVYAPKIQLKEGAGPGTYKFKVSRPNWAGTVTWKFYSRVLHGEQLPVEESSQYLGKYWMVQGNRYTEFSVILKNSTEDDEKPGGDLEPEDDPSPDEDPNPDDDPNPEDDPNPDEDPKPDEDPNPDDDPTPDDDPNPDEDPSSDDDPKPDGDHEGGKDQDPDDQTKPDHPSKPSGGSEKPGPRNPEGEEDLKDKQDWTGKMDDGEKEVGDESQSVIIEIQDKRSEDQGGEAGKEEKKPGQQAENEDGYELLQNIVIEEDDLEEVGGKGAGDQASCGQIAGNDMVGDGGDGSYVPPPQTMDGGGAYGQAPQTGQSRIYEIVASLSSLALFAIAKENRRRKRKE